MTGGTTDLTDVIITTEVSPTAVLEDILLAVIDGRGGISSQLQAQILVCATLYTHVYVSHNNITSFSFCAQALDEQYTILMLQQLIYLLSSSRECDVNLRAAVSTLSLAVINFGDQTVEKAVSEVHKRKDNPLC
jgi:hypothetical protein